MAWYLAEANMSVFVTQQQEEIHDMANFVSLPQSIFMQDIYSE